MLGSGSELHFIPFFNLSLTGYIFPMQGKALFLLILNKQSLFEI